MPPEYCSHCPYQQAGFRTSFAIYRGRRASLRKSLRCHHQAAVHACSTFLRNGQGPDWKTRLSLNSAIPDHCTKGYYYIPGKATMLKKRQLGLNRSVTMAYAPGGIELAGTRDHRRRARGSGTPAFLMSFGLLAPTRLTWEPWRKNGSISRC